MDAKYHVYILVDKDMKILYHFKIAARVQKLFKKENSY